MPLCNAMTNSMGSYFLFHDMMTVALRKATIVPFLLLLLLFLLPFFCDFLVSSGKF